MAKRNTQSKSPAFTPPPPAGFTKAKRKSAYERLREYYLSHDQTYEQIAAEVSKSVGCRVTTETVRRVALGQRVLDRTIFKIERFLDGLPANAA